MEATRKIILAFVLVTGLIAAPALAQAPNDVPDEPAAEAPEAETTDDGTPVEVGEVVLWDIRGDDAARLDAFRKGVREALSGASKSHILSEIEFSAHIAKEGPEPPACLRGVEDCVTPGALVFDALGLSSLVRVDVLAVGANFDVIDARGRSVRQGEVVESDARKLGFAVVRDIFDATGIVTIDSEPEGATVELDGRSVGTTPLTYRVAVGEHTYKIRLPNRTAVEGTVTVSRGEGVSVNHDLALTPGTLMVLNAPPGAEIYIDGEKVGGAAAPIELPPGTHSMEVRAEGYDPVKEMITVEPGVTVTRSVPMGDIGGFASDISSDAIIFNNYILRLGLEGGFQRGTFQDARSSDDVAYEFISFADGNGNLPGAGVTLAESIATFGLRLDLSYAFRNFGIAALSLSYLSRKVNFPGFVGQRGSTPEPVSITSVRRLQVRPFQLFYRYFYKRFVPFAEAGIGINFAWLQAEGAQFEGAKTLRRTDALWTLGLGGQYYFTNNLFGVVRYSIQDYFERGLGTDHQLMIGFGTAFPNLFGLDPEPPNKL